ncbi:UNVERIFIED_CONTAM: hypothetical protein ABIC26_004631 [Paenibacillus sp. PvR008]
MSDEVSKKRAEMSQERLLFFIPQATALYAETYPKLNYVPFDQMSSRPRDWPGIATISKLK